jgi:hypothetical protein
MTLANRAGPFPKSPHGAALLEIENGLVYGSIFLTAAVSSDHVSNPEALNDIPI